MLSLGVGVQSEVELVEKSKGWKRGQEWYHDPAKWRFQYKGVLMFLLLLLNKFLHLWERT